MDPFVPYVLAELRSIELQKEAERSRLLADCPRRSVRHHPFLWVAELLARGGRYAAMWRAGDPDISGDTPGPEAEPPDEILEPTS